MARTLLVTRDTGKEFRVTIPDDAKVTFGPWSPPTAASKGYNDAKSMAGTLRIYKGSGVKTENILAVFSGVATFRDEELDYEEKVTIEEGATIWKSDKNGYRKEEKVNRQHQWINPDVALLGEADDDEA